MPETVEEKWARLSGKSSPSRASAPSSGESVEEKWARLGGGAAPASIEPVVEDDSIGLTNFLDVIPGYKRHIREPYLDVGAEFVRDVTRQNRHPLTPHGISYPLSEVIPGMMEPVPSHEISIPTNRLPEMPSLSSVADLLLNDDYRTPYTKGKAYQQRQAERKPTTIDLGVAANFLSGVPGAMAETAMEFPGEVVAGNVASAGEQLASMGMARALPAIGGAAKTVGGALGKGADILAEATPTFTQGGKTLVRTAQALGDKYTPNFMELANPNTWKFRGGYDPAALQTFDDWDNGNVRAGHAQEDMAGLFTDPLTGRPMTGRERHFTAMLATQPEQRAVLESIEALPAEINRTQQSAFALAAQELPGTPGSQVMAAQAAFPESTMPLKTFSQRADQIAKMWGFNKGKLSEYARKDPQEWTRFNDDNYFPEAYANTRLSSLPSAPLRERSNFMGKRRDISATERMNAESIDPVQRAYDRMGDQRRLINNHTLFNQLSLNPDVVYRPGFDPMDTLVDLSQLKTGDTIRFGANKYVKMAEDPKGLGVLSGQLVKAEEAGEINALLQQPGRMRRIMNTWWSAWKHGNTIQNPKTHIRNMTSNVMMAHAEGLSPHRIDIYKAALRDVQYGGKMWQEARDNAAPWTSRNRRAVLSEIMGEGDLEASGDAMVAGWTSIPRWMMSNKPAKAMANAYEDSEALFKQALYRYKRELGIPPAEAIRQADRAIINYGKVPQWVKKVRAFPGGVPFITFTYGATPLVVETALTKPQLFMRYKIFADSWNELAMEKIKMSPQERQDFETLYAGGIPMLAYDRDASGSAKVFDVARNTPVSDFIPGRAELPIAPAILENLLAKSPAVSLVSGLFTGIDPFTKAEFSPHEVVGSRVGADLNDLESEESMLFDVPAKERMAADALFAFNQLASNPAKAAVRVGRAAGGKPNIFGDQKDVGESLWSELFGPIRNMNNDRDRADAALLKQKLKAERTARRVAARGD